jgi:glycosyltransferase involved in cell wall biosynthesis
MPKFNIRLVSSYPPRVCGIARFAENLATALARFRDVGHVRVAAISHDEGSYNLPVDIVINQYDARSWEQAADSIAQSAQEEERPSVVVLQHEYGLDGAEGTGANYVNLARELRDRGLTVIAYLHTVLRSPNDHQRTILQQIAANTGGLVVTLSAAIEILRASYGIDRSKVTHIDHGIRMRDIKTTDRLRIKRRYGLEHKFLATTMGLLSPDKGVHYGVRAYALFLGESCTPRQRSRLVYLIAGQYHPGFVESGGGAPYRAYRELLAQTVADCGLRWRETDGLSGVDFDSCDVCFLNAYLSEDLLMALYGATNVMVLPYLNAEQVSSGILADTVGSGRAAIASKTMYARELLGDPGGQGTVITSRGILVDPGEASVEQIAQGLDFLAFNEKQRLAMERDARARGYEMRWENAAWDLIQYIKSVEEDRSVVTGRGPEFVRERASRFDRSG